MDFALTMHPKLLIVEYMAELFDEVTIERILGSMISTLQHMADSIQAPALSGTLLGAKDASELAALSMAVEKPGYITAVLPHEQFELNASASPERRCLCYEGEWLDYDEVAQRVAAGAARLASLGVGPGVVVGVMLDRSLVAVFRAVALLADQIGVHVPATDFIATPTARQVAYIIKKKQRLAGALDLDIVYAKDWTDNERPVSSGQESLYMSFLLNPASLELNEGPCVELHGDLNLSVFEAALNELVQRHEVFRYSFQHSSNGVQIFLTDVVKVPFKIMEAGLTKAEIRKRLEKEYAVPFDLSSPPLLRCTIAPIGPKEHIVFLPMHHILMDGWSAGRLWVDVMGLYTAALTNTVADLPALPVKFGDYAAWERMLLAPDTPEHNKLLDYWKGKLKYATPVVQLPYDHPRPMNGASESPPVALGTTLNLDAVKILKDVGSKKRLSLYSICAAAYRMMLCEFSASDDVVIASSYSIRPPGTENLFGYFLRMLLLRNRLEEGDTFATLAQREMKTLTGAIEHSILPLQDVIRVSDFPRAPGRTPAWQASITWDEEDWMDPSAAKNKAEAPLAIKLFPLHPPTSPTDITLGLIPSANGLHLSLHADGAIFLPATVQRMLNRIPTLTI
ncbi:hypothetical protein Ndes2526A_g00989 [Nannochloris sp. 'desiccata']